MDCCLATVYWRTLLWTLAKQVSYHFPPKSRPCDNPSQGGSKSVIVLTSSGAPDGVDRGYTPEGTHPGNKCGLFPPVQSDVWTLSIWRGVSKASVRSFTVWEECGNMQLCKEKEMDFP